MQALITTNNPLRLVATKLLSYFTPKAFVGWQSPMQLREIADPALPAPDWLVAKTRLCGLCGSDYKQVFMNGMAVLRDARAATLRVLPAGKIGAVPQFWRWPHCARYTPWQ